MLINGLLFYYEYRYSSKLFLVSVTTEFENLKIGKMYLFISIQYYNDFKYFKYLHWT